MPFLSNRNDLDIEKALTAMVVAPKLEDAKAMLEEMGFQTTTEVLRVWRDQTFPERFQRRRVELASQVEQQFALDMIDGARRTDAVVNIAVEKAADMLAKGQVRDPARVARDLQQVSTQKLEKAFMSQGRPTKIVATRDANEILRALEAMKVIDLPPSEVVEDEQHELSTGDG